MSARLWGSRGLIVALALLLLAVGERAAAQTGTVTCKLGTYITSIHDIETAEGTFEAEFWMWSVCPTDQINPLDTLEFVNGEGVEGSLEATIKRGDLWWSTRMFTGVFRTEFDLQNYPFDRQSLQIHIEEAVLDNRSLLYSADTAASGTNPRVGVSGWRLGQMELTAGITSHPTTFGDPSLTGGVSRYASMEIVMSAERVHWETFLRVTFPLYIVALLAFASLMLDIASTDMFLGRMGVLGSMLFSVVLSFSSTEQLVGQHEGMYLLDLLHLVVLIVIVAASGWAIMAHRHAADAEDPAPIRCLDQKVSIGLAAGFLGLNALLLIMAQVNG